MDSRGRQFALCILQLQENPEDASEAAKSIMATKSKALSEAEVWDDSALLQSWDEALVEYKVIRCIMPLSCH